jgi:hypothetical protein
MGRRGFPVRRLGTGALAVPSPRVHAQARPSMPAELRSWEGGPGTARTQREVAA